MFNACCIVLFSKKKKSLISLFYPFLGDFRFLQRFTRYLRSSGMLRNIGGLFYTDVSVVITASRYLTTKHRPHDSLQNCVHLPAFFVDRLTLEGGKYMLFRNVRNKLGARGSLVVKVLRYKPAGRGFDSRWCHWNLSVT